MRKLFNLILVAAVLTACKTPTPDPVNISITPATAQMKVGDMTTLEVTGATANIEWSTSNEEVASVYHGVVTAKAIGKAEITAKVGTPTANSIVYVSGTHGASLLFSPAKVNMR